MKGFLWSRLEGLTSRYHSGGAALVICDGDVADARAVLQAYIEKEAAGCAYEKTRENWLDEFKNWNKKEDWEKVRVFDMPRETEQEVLIFEDAGCC